MTEVEISNLHGRWRVTVGAVDLTKAIAANGLRVEFPPEPARPLVHITFRPRALNLRLDEAVVQATEKLLSGRDSAARGGTLNRSADAAADEAAR